MSKNDDENSLFVTQDDERMEVDEEGYKDQVQVEIQEEDKFVVERNEDDEDMTGGVDEENSRDGNNTSTTANDSRNENDDEDDDPVVREFPVFSSNRLGDKLRLLQYPTRSVFRPLVQDQGRGIFEARLKPQSGLIEVDVPFETRKFYDKEKGETWNNIDRQTFGGVLKKGQGRYMVGVFKNGELYVNPIHSVAQLRSQFKYFDKQMTEEKDASKSLKVDPTKPREAKAVQMSAKVSGESAPKYSGALAARKVADEETFIKLDWFDRDSNESWEISDKLVTNNKQALKSSITMEEYTDSLMKI